MGGFYLGDSLIERLDFRREGDGLGVGSGDFASLWVGGWVGGWFSCGWEDRGERGGLNEQL